MYYTFNITGATPEGHGDLDAALLELTMETLDIFKRGLMRTSRLHLGSIIPTL